jgi:replicative DNA helicase
VQVELAQKRERIIEISKLPGISPELANHQAEEAVIGGILQAPEAYLTIGELVEAVDFDDKFNAITWYAFEELSANNTRIDLVTVSDVVVRYQEKHGLNRQQCLERLGMLMGSTPKASNVMHHAKLVREAGQRLRIDQAALRIKTMARDRNISNEQLIDAAETELAKASEALAIQSSSAAQRIEQFEKTLQDRATSGAEGVQWGFHTIDTHNGGLYPQRVTILAGHSGSGKTTIALSIIRNVCKAGKRVVFLSIEMTADDIMQEFMTMETGLWRSKMRIGKLTTQEWQTFYKGKNEIASWKLDILDTLPRNSPAAIRRNLKRLQAHNHVDLLVIDGLWLTEDDDAFGNLKSWEVLQRNIRKFVRMAKDLHIPILLLHQYGEGYNNVDKPTLNTLMGGQAIHNDPHEVFALWRKKGEEKSLLYHLKQRGGSLHKEPFELHYNTTYSTYEVYERVEDVPF